MYTCLPVMKYAIGQYRNICNNVILIITLGKSIAIVLLYHWYSHNEKTPESIEYIVSGIYGKIEQEQFYCARVALHAC